MQRARPWKRRGEPRGGGGDGEGWRVCSLATTPKPTDIDLAHGAPHTAMDVAALNQRGGAFWHARTALELCKAPSDHVHCPRWQRGRRYRECACFGWKPPQLENEEDIYSRLNTHFPDQLL